MRRLRRDSRAVGGVQRILALRTDRLFGISCLTPRIGSGPPGRAFVGASRRGPQRYPLTPLPDAAYRQRTRQNVIDSDGTAILFYESLSVGTKVTRDFCVREKKPFVVLDAKLITAAAAIVRFVGENEIKVLNMAGLRLSGWPQEYGFALGVVGKLIGGNQ